MSDFKVINSDLNITLENTGETLYIETSGITINFPEYTSPDNFDSFNCVIINDSNGDIFIDLADTNYYALLSNRSAHVSGNKDSGFSIYYTPSKL